VKSGNNQRFWRDIVNSMIVIAEAIEDAQDASALEEIKRIAIKQLRIIAIGVAGWRSG
jgi:hypothetical protein